MESDEKIAERLNSLVKSRGFSVKEIAELCEVTSPNMSGYLNGSRPLGLKVIKKLKHVIPSLDLEWLLYGVENIAAEPSAVYKRQHSADGYLDYLIAIKNKAIEKRIETMEHDFNKEIDALKNKIELGNVDSEMIAKLMKIIDKTTH